MSLARQRPEITKLPESSVSPAALGMASASPVMRPSFTWPWPLRTSASAGIWLPEESSMTSLRTSSWLWTSVSFPSRTVGTLASDSRVSFSMVRLDLICWTMPMPVLAATMRRKLMSFQSPTTKRQTARMIKIRLK